MTTISYHKPSGLLAVDSRTTGSGYIVSDFTNKIIKREDGCIFIGCGPKTEILELIESYPTPKKSIRAFEALIFILKDGEVYRMGCDRGIGVFIDRCDTSEAEGSGGIFALAAMDFGCSAFDAVKYAMTRDYNTGGEIQVINCITGELFNSKQQKA